jgi:RHS repeat-associated protein
LNRARYKGALWLGSDADSGQDIYFMRARWYEPRTGRFLSEDPLGLAGGLNQYAYAGNDPINKGDPSGLCENDEDKVLSEKEVELDGVTATSQTCQSGDGTVYWWLENISLPPVTVVAYGVAADTRLDDLWNTPTWEDALLDQMTNFDQWTGQLCPTLGCLPRNPVSPRQIVQCQAAEAWTGINAFLDVNAAKETLQLVRGGIELSEWLAKHLVSNTFSGSGESLMRTGHLPSADDLFDELALGVVPGHGYSRALADQHILCARH